jgi:hypothetical protein
MQSPEQRGLTSVDVAQLRDDPRNRFCEFEHGRVRDAWDMRVVMELVDRVHATRCAHGEAHPEASDAETRAHIDEREPQFTEFAAAHPKLAEMLLGKRITEDPKVFPLLKAMIASHIKMQDGEQSELDTQKEFIAAALPQLTGKPEGE